MNSSKIKCIFMMITGTAFLILLGILLNSINLHILINLAIYILLIPAILMSAKVLYNLFDKSLKPLMVIDFVLLGIFYLTMLITKSIVSPTNICMLAYEYLMGYLALNGFLGASKCSAKTHNANVYKYIGIFLFSISVIVGLLALFGLAK